MLSHPLDPHRVSKIFQRIGKFLILVDKVENGNHGKRRRFVIEVVQQLRQLIIAKAHARDGVKIRDELQRLLWKQIRSKNNITTRYERP